MEGIDAVRRARAASNAGEWAAAVECWRDIARRNSTLESLWRLAEAELALERPDRALEAASRAAEIEPAEPRVLALIGRAHRRLGNAPGARDAWLRVLQVWPDNFEALVCLAEAQYWLGQRAAARLSLRKALLLRPNESFALWLLERIMQEEFAYGEDANAPAATHPTRPTPEPTLRSADPRAPPKRMVTRTTETATQLGLVGTTLDGTSLDRLARAMVDERRFDTAAEIITMRLGLPDAPVAAFNEHARILRLLGREAEIVQIVEATCAARREDVGLLLHLARLLDKIGESERAIALLESNLGGQYDYSEGSVLLLRLLAKRGSGASAILQRWASAVAVGSPGRGSAVELEVAQRLAHALLIAGRIDDAARLLNSYSERHQDTQLGLQVQLRLLLAQQLPEAALIVARSCLERHGRHIWVGRSAVHALLDAGEIDSAHEIARDALSQLTGAVPRWLDLAEALVKWDVIKPIREALDTIRIDSAAEIFRAGRLSLQLGAPGIAMRLLAGIGPDVSNGAEAQTLRRLAARSEALSGVAVHGYGTHAAAVYAEICRLALAHGSPPRNPEGPILLVNSSLAAGGAERQIANVLQGLSRWFGGSERIQLLCTRLGEEPERRVNLPRIAAAGIKVTCLSGVPAERPELSIDADQRDLLMLLPSPLRSAVLDLVDAFRRLRPAVVHLWQDRTIIEGGIAALMAGVPRVILSARSTRPTTRQRYRPYYDTAYHALLSAPHVTLCNNSSAGAADYEGWLGLAPGSVAVVQNGFDFDELSSRAPDDAVAALRQSLGLAPGALVLGGVMRLAAVKRPLLWIEAAAIAAHRLPGLKLLLVGEGQQRAEVESLARRFSIMDRLIMPGFVDTPPYYRLMDICMLTSVTEGLPNVLVEAHAMGVPTVATRVGGVPETLIEGITGWSVTTQTAEALADRVIASFSDSAWRVAAGKRASAFARERFGIRANLDRTLALYGLEYRTGPEPIPRRRHLRCVPLVEAKSNSQAPRLIHLPGDDLPDLDLRKNAAFPRVRLLKGPRTRHSGAQGEWPDEGR